MPVVRSELFQRYAAAVDLLWERFGSGDRGALGTESRDRFDLHETGLSVDWLAARLEDLAASLLELRFQIVLEIVAPRIAGSFGLDPVAGAIDATAVKWTAAQPDAEVPEEAAAAYRSLRDWLKKPDSEKSRPLVDLIAILQELEAAGAALEIDLRISLDKSLEVGGVAQSFAAGGTATDRPRPIVFLYPERLAGYLESLDLDRLEQECFHPGQRTVCLVFDLRGGFGNDLLELVGRGRAERLDPLLEGALATETVAAVGQVRTLHKAGGVWVQPSRWLIPELFDVGPPAAERADPRAAGILDRLRLVRALLAGIFLADHTEIPAGEKHPRVRYQGLGQVSFQISPAALARCGGQGLDDLFGLYRYAYEGYSVDKLEIAQRFLSLLAKDLEGLCAKAAEVKGATKQTYERALQDKIGEYFDARHKLQERIKTAVAEASESVLGLTRDVSGDLYKIAGLLVGAVVAAFLKPELSPLALKAVAIAIGTYAGIILALHLTTLRRSYRLRMDQHESYIKSFESVLREGEIDDYLKDPELERSQALWDDRIDWVTAVYIFYVLAALFFLVTADQLLGSPASPAAGEFLHW